MLTISSDVSILGRQRQPLSGLLWAYCNPPITSPGKLPLLISNSSAGFEPTTSRSAGRILGDPRAVSQVGRKGGTKVFKYGRKSPWVPTLTELFPNIQADAGSWLGTKKALYHCAHSANSFSWVVFVSSYTTAIVLPDLPGSFTKLVRARETNQKPETKELQIDESKKRWDAISRTNCICPKNLLFLTDHNVS